MNGAETVQNVIKMLEAQDLREAAQHLSGDFVLTGWTSHPCNKGQFLALFTALKQSIPDLAFHMQNLREDYQTPQSDRVDAEIQFTGTQTRIFSLAQYDRALDEIQARAITLPREPISFTIMGNTIESMIFRSAKDTGLNGLLAQMQKDEIEDIPAILSTLTYNFHQAHRHMSGAELPANEEDKKTYNKQSNLYDPEHRTYTPSQDSPDYAPQVDVNN